MRGDWARLAHCFSSVLPQYFVSYKNPLTFVSTKPFDNTVVVLKEEVLNFKLEMSNLYIHNHLEAIASVRIIWIDNDAPRLCPKCKV